MIRLFLPAGSPAVFIASHINRVVTWSFVFMAMSTVLFSVMRAAGAVTVPLCIVTVVLVVRFPLTLAVLARWHADAIWWSFPVSQALTAVFAALYYRYGSWRGVELAVPEGGSTDTEPPIATVDPREMAPKAVADSD